MNKQLDPADISLCPGCYCMTHTLTDSTCGKCGADKATFKEPLKVGDNSDDAMVANNEAYREYREGLEPDEMDAILEQLQYGTIMSDNQEPMLTNNRTIAKAALQALGGRHVDYNTMVADNVRAVANSDGPALWRDPVTSKYLYNEHEAHRRTAAVLEDLLSDLIDQEQYEAGAIVRMRITKLNQEGH